MDFTFLQADAVPIWETLLRVLLAIAFGFMLGYDRKKKHKTIGVQSYPIIALSTCLIAIMSQELYQNYARIDEVVTIDFAKIISGVLTGIGFLGAGAIIKRDGEEEVVGSATGASIWAAGGLGLILGYGFYTLSIIGFLGLIAILTLANRFYRKVK